MIKINIDAFCFLLIPISLISVIFYCFSMERDRNTNAIFYYMQATEYCESNPKRICSTIKDFNLYDYKTYKAIIEFYKNEQ